MACHSLSDLVTFWDIFEEVENKEADLRYILAAVDGLLTKEEAARNMQAVLKNGDKI